ncbi:MAG: pantoate--beta-alanine ligase [Marmoricola sp.]|nr:pantoate--beta-alanine ligase [Marmoricola sp.]
MTTTLVRAESRADLRGALAGHGGRVGFVPTMGALHDGHAALIRRARDEVGPEGLVVVSIFVNPLQFAPGEDLDRYPRTLDADLAACAEAGADVVFVPPVDEVYPGGEPQVTVDPGPLAAILEGASRPTHFAGVLTVVAKLFGLVRPDVAVFGEKDYQQLALVRRMATDLCLGVEVIGAETVREPDGLARSSRNRFLDPAQRRHALALSEALFAGRNAGGSADAALSAAVDVLDAAEGIELDYLALTATDLGDVPASGPARLLVAARVGSTRLIDNIAVDLGPAPATTSPHPSHTNAAGGS